MGPLSISNMPNELQVFRSAYLKETGAYDLTLPVAGDRRVTGAVCAIHYPLYSCRSSFENTAVESEDPSRKLPWQHLSTIFVTVLHHFYIILQ